MTQEEIQAIATFMHLDIDQFIQDYTRLRPNREGLALIDQADGACFFLKGNDCSIQTVKPQQCKDFPNGWNFPGWRNLCKAIEVPVRDMA